MNVLNEFSVCHFQSNKPRQQFQRLQIVLHLMMFSPAGTGRNQQGQAQASRVDVQARGNTVLG